MMKHCFHAKGGSGHEFGGHWYVTCCFCGMHGSQRYTVESRPIPNHGPHTSRSESVGHEVLHRTDAGEMIDVTDAECPGGDRQMVEDAPETCLNAGVACLIEQQIAEALAGFCGCRLPYDDYTRVRLWECPECRVKRLAGALKVVFANFVAPHIETEHLPAERQEFAAEFVAYLAEGADA